MRTVEERNIAMCIILSLVTCGIYGLYWFVCLTEDTNAAANEEGTSGVMALVFTLITCGIYGLYWAINAVKSWIRLKQTEVCRLQTGVFSI